MDNGSGSENFGLLESILLGDLSNCRNIFNKFFVLFGVESIILFKKKFSLFIFCIKVVYVFKVSELIVVLLDVIVFGDVGVLWEVIKRFNMVEKVLLINEFDSIEKVYFIVLVEIYCYFIGWDIC